MEQDAFNPYAPPVSAEPFHVTEADEHVLASRGRRFFGSMIDGLLLLAPYGIGILLVTDIDHPTDGDGVLLILMLVAMLAVGIVQAVLIARSGQSLAKRMLGMRIVRLDGSPCGFLHGVFVRSWVFTALASLPLVGGFLGLIDALYIFGSEQRCLHDVLAGTKVVLVETQVE